MSRDFVPGWIMWDDASMWFPPIDRPTRPTLRLTDVDRAELERLLVEDWPLLKAFAQVLLWRGLPPSEIEAAMVRRRLILPASSRELSITELLRAWRLLLSDVVPRTQPVRSFGST